MNSLPLTIANVAFIEIKIDEMSGQYRTGIDQDDWIIHASF